MTSRSHSTVAMKGSSIVWDEEEFRYRAFRFRTREDFVQAVIVGWCFASRAVASESKSMLRLNWTLVGENRRGQWVEEAAMALSSAFSMKLGGIELTSNCNDLSSCMHFYRTARSRRTRPRARAAQSSVANWKNVADKVTVCRGGGSLERADSGEKFEGCSSTGKAAEAEDHINDSSVRIVFTAVFGSFGSSISDSSAAATQLDPNSSHALSSAEMLPRVVSILGDLDSGTAQLATSLAGPFITIFNLLFIFRIVMSWYPGIPIKKFPFFLVYNPTEPVLGPTRRLIPPVGGVDVAPVIWVAIMSFANEILLGKQGLLVLLSQQQA